MTYPKFICAPTLLGAALFASLGSSVQAQFISNGNLETLDAGTPVFESWSNNAGVTLALQPINGGNSARISLNTGGAGNALNQNPVDPDSLLSKYSVSLDFATSNPGGTTARSFQLNLRTVPGSEGGNINMRVVNGTVAGMGTVEVFQGIWNAVLPNSINFSTSETDAGFLINTLTIDGDYSGVAPSYSITANGTTASDLSFFQTSAPAPDATLTQISFQSGNIASGAWSVVDNVSVVPEPSSIALFGLGAVGLIAFGRRKFQANK